jgi:hypothetical protein
MKPKKMFEKIVSPSKMVKKKQHKIKHNNKKYTNRIIKKYNCDKR